MREKCAAKHHGSPGKETRRRVQTALSHPKKHESADGKDMQGDRPVDRDWQRQNEKDPVGRIKLRALHAAEVRCAAEDVRIPQGQVSLSELAETEVAPCVVLQEQIARLISEHARAAGEQDIGEHCECQRQQKRERNDRGTPARHQSRIVP